MFLFFLLMSVLFLYPIYWMLINSLKSSVAFYESSSALPKDWLFVNYIRVFTDFNIRGYTYFEMLFNSLWMTGLNIFCNLMSSMVLAYAVSKYRFPGRNFLYGLVIFIQTIPIISAGSTGYKLFYKLGMIDNPLTFWIAWCVGFDFAFIVLYGAFKGVSNSYAESGRIDGASELQIMFRLMLPQVKTVIIALAITQAVGRWNDYSTSMIYLRSFPNLAYGIYIFDTESGYLQDAKPIYLAAIVISIIPPAVLYTCNQKIILENMSAGGLKG